MDSISDLAIYTIMLLMAVGLVSTVLGTILGLYFAVRSADLAAVTEEAHAKNKDKVHRRHTP